MSALIRRLVTTMMVNTGRLRVVVNTVVIANVELLAVVINPADRMFSRWR